MMRGEEEIKMQQSVYTPIEREMFHIHTYRCGHAENVSDEEFVKRAVELGASRIVFTDHAPFPGNPFGQRMKYEELDEYITSIRGLHDKYSGEIEVLCGLEAEYLPTYKNYFEYLREKTDLLIIGQHFYEVDGKYSFELPKDELVDNECMGASLAIIRGIETGLFDVVAHPDRIYRRRKHWESDMAVYGTNILYAAQKHNIPVEINNSSKKHKHHFWPEFWRMIEIDDALRGCKTVNGLDAHFLSELQIFAIE